MNILLIINYKEEIDDIYKIKNNIKENKTTSNYTYTYELSNESNKNYVDNNNSKKYELLYNLNGKKTIKNKDNNNNIYILEEKKKNEMIQNIISLVLQDTNQLNQLNRYFGEDIGEKLLKKEINQDILFKIIDILKNYQTNINLNNKNEKNLFRGSKKNYKNYINKRFNQLNDNIILRETLNNNNEYLNREYPIGLLSMNDYY